MTRSLCFAVTVAAILAGSSARAEGQPSKKRPNVLFILTDDQSYRTLSCYKEDAAWLWVRTPNLDRLAAEGVRFTHPYAAPWCTPSRAVILTGLLPHAIQGLTLQNVFEGGYDPRLCRFWPAELAGRAITPP